LESAAARCASIIRGLNTTCPDSALRVAQRRPDERRNDFRPTVPLHLDSFPSAFPTLESVAECDNDDGDF
jgi:hypothetical protein